jgi:hypothetical protein
VDEEWSIPILDNAASADISKPHVWSAFKAAVGDAFTFAQGAMEEAAPMRRGLGILVLELDKHNDPAWIRIDDELGCDRVVSPAGPVPVYIGQEDFDKVRFRVLGAVISDTVLDCMFAKANASKLDWFIFPGLGGSAEFKRAFIAKTAGLVAEASR